jgi:hypothetical protein
MVTVAEARDALRLRYPSEYNDMWAVAPDTFGNDGFTFRRWGSGGLEDAPPQWERFEPLGYTTSTARPTVTLSSDGVVTIDKALFDDICLIVNTIVNSVSPASTNERLTMLRSIHDRLPKPVDPDVIAARQWLKSQPHYVDSTSATLKVENGEYDDHMPIRAFLAGVKHTHT